MKKEVNNNLIFLILKTAITELVTVLLFISIFAAVMYFANIDKSLSPVFGTIAVSIGALVASFFTAKKVGCKGYLTGFIIGISTFIIVLIVSLIIDDGGITINTLFHFIIYVLSSLIGGITGVNKKGKKYI